MNSQVEPKSGAEPALLRAHKPATSTYAVVAGATLAMKMAPGAAEMSASVFILVLATDQYHRSYR